MRREIENLTAHIEEEVTLQLHVDMVAQHTIVHHRVAPIVLEFSGFARYKADDKRWYSDGFMIITRRMY